MHIGTQLDEEMDDELRFLAGCPLVHQASSRTYPWRHAQIAPLFTRDAFAIAPDLFPQRGLLGSVLRQYRNSFGTVPNDPRLYVNTQTPWSAVVCGAEGTGKSHSVSCILEASLIQDSRIGTHHEVLAGVVFHFDEGQGRICEAASLSMPTAHGVAVRDVTILVSPRNLTKMKNTYRALPNVDVRPLYFREAHLSANRLSSILDLEGMSSSAPMALYTIPEMSPTYSEFKRSVAESKSDEAQKANRKLPPSLIDFFISDLLDDVTSFFGRGKLVIVDLSDPFLNVEAAALIFDLVLGLFVEWETETGKALVLDRSHNYLTNTRLIRSVSSVIRQQRRLGIRIIISTQEPTTIPGTILDLSSFIICHQFSSPAWCRHLESHISIWSKTAGREDAPWFDQVMGLRTGEALVFSSKALCIADMSHSTRESLLFLGIGYLVIQIRPRITLSISSLGHTAQTPSHSLPHKPGTIIIPKNSFSTCTERQPRREQASISTTGWSSFSTSPETVVPSPTLSPEFYPLIMTLLRLHSEGIEKPAPRLVLQRLPDAALSTVTNFSDYIVAARQHGVIDISYIPDMDFGWVKLCHLLEDNIVTPSTPGIKTPTNEDSPSKMDLNTLWKPKPFLISKEKPSNTPLICSPDPLAMRTTQNQWAHTLRSENSPVTPSVKPSPITPAGPQTFIATPADLYVPSVGPVTPVPNESATTSATASLPTRSTVAPPSSSFPASFPASLSQSANTTTPVVPVPSIGGHMQPSEKPFEQPQIKDTVSPQNQHQDHISGAGLNAWMKCALVAEAKGYVKLGSLRSRAELVSIQDSHGSGGPPSHPPSLTTTSTIEINSTPIVKEPISSLRPYGWFPIPPHTDNIDTEVIPPIILPPMTTRVVSPAHSPLPVHIPFSSSDGPLESVPTRANRAEDCAILPSDSCPPLRENCPISLGPDPSATASAVELTKDPNHYFQSLVDILKQEQKRLFRQKIGHYYLAPFMDKHHPGYLSTLGFKGWKDFILACENAGWVKVELTATGGGWISLPEFESFDSGLCAPAPPQATGAGSNGICKSPTISSPSVPAFPSVNLHGLDMPIPLLSPILSTPALDFVPLSPCVPPIVTENVPELTDAGIRPSISPPLPADEQISDMPALSIPHPSDNPTSSPSISIQSFDATSNPTTILPTPDANPYFSFLVDILSGQRKREAGQKKLFKLMSARYPDFLTKSSFTDWTQFLCAAEATGFIVRKGNTIKRAATQAPVPAVTTSGPSDIYPLVN